MKKQNHTFLIYMAVFFGCVWWVGNKVNAQNNEPYNLEIEKYRYQLSYPDTYSRQTAPYGKQVIESVAEEKEEEQVVKTAYITFDDGPSPRTGEILDILKEQEVKATFFVVKNEEKYTEYMKRAAREGHSVGVHSASHKYGEIYQDVDSFLEDFTDCRKYIEDNTGQKPVIFRFPGGSVNKYNKDICRPLIEEMTRRGYAYFDWNVESGDGTGKLSSQQVYQNVIDGCKGRKRAVIIMHDSANKKSTVEALEGIITTLKADGWQFARLDPDVKPMVFRLK